MDRLRVVQLPPIEPIKSSRIYNFQDYANWQKNKKQAYRQQLRKQIVAHEVIRQKQQQQKQQDLKNVQTIIQSERERVISSKFDKIKTEQKYQAQNLNLLQKSYVEPRRVNNPEREYRQHPFVQLIDQEDKRRLETKNNFIFQNKLNDIQSEMKRQQSQKRRVHQVQQRKKQDKHVESEYQKKKKDRQQFENKYLRLDKSGKEDFKKQYLDFLKKQANENKSYRHYEGANFMSQANKASPGNIGLSPASFDRIKQLQFIQKSLKIGFNESKQLKNNSTVLGSYDKGSSIDIIQKRRRMPYQKVVTQRAVGTIDVCSDQLDRSRERPNRGRIQSQFSQRPQRAQLSRRQFKQYDIINGNQKIFLQ